MNRVRDRFPRLYALYRKSGFLTGVWHFVGDLFALLQRHTKKWLWAVHGHLHKSITTRTKAGVFTVMTQDHVIGRILYTFGEFEFEIMSKSMDLLRSKGFLPARGSGTVLDVGANNGVSCITMLMRGEAARCVAIEPDPINFALLEKNVNQNGLSDRIVCIQKAVSVRQEVLTLELSSTNFGDHKVRYGAAQTRQERHGELAGKVVSVDAAPLDDLVDSLPREFADSISLLWMDIQGFEHFAFKGATRLLQRGIPVVTEIWPYGMRRAGTDERDFCALAKRYWSRYWILQYDRFIEYPIDHLPWLFHMLGDDQFDNIVLAR